MELYLFGTLIDIFQTYFTLLGNYFIWLQAAN
jgi:hypothetical protein